MSEISEQYQRLSDEFANKIAKVPDDKWSAPSPCPDWTTRDVVQHVVDTQGMFLGFVGKELGSIPSVDDDPAAAWDAARAQTQRALDDPAVAGTEFDGFFGRSRYDEAVNRFLCFDLVVHAWDLSPRPDSTSGSTPTTWLGCAPRPKRSATRCGVRARSAPRSKRPPAPTSRRNSSRSSAGGPEQLTGFGKPATAEVVIRVAKVRSGHTFSTLMAR